MKPIPPHLPKKEKPLVAPSQKHSIFYFISCAFISIAASLSTVFVALSWIIPRAVPEVQFYNFPHETQKTAEATIDSDLVNRIGEREAILYDKRTQLPGGWYALGSAISTGVFLTSDGWTVFPLEANTQIDKTNLALFQVVDSRGASYTLDQVMIDKTFHLAYAKVNGGGFRFVSFPNWDVFRGDTRVVGRKNDTYDFDTLVNLKKNPQFATTSATWQPQYLFHLAKAEPGILFTDQGELLGVAQNTGVLPGWYIESALASLLSKHTLSYGVFPWKGEMVDRGLDNGFLKKVNGFFVADLGGDKTKDGLKIGDVITKIEGKEVSFITLSRQILQSPETVNIEIIRDGTSLQKSLTKQSINF